MLLVALTGGIGCGKSTAVKYFRSLGILLIDADKIARQVVEPGQPAYLKLREEFGAEYFDDENDGKLRREKLGELVFSNQEKRRKLNGITHPAIRKQIFLQIAKAFLSGRKYIVLDIPLLFESGSYWFIQKIIVIHCTPEKQLERLCQRDNMSVDNAKARISAQLPNEYKIKRANFCIDNNGTIQETHEQLQKVVECLNQSWYPFVFRTVLISGFVALGWILMAAIF
ncbi:Dephospho-CoA kinase 1 [Aphelenchoides bicaudatus]|nr:Dephospho-CoA kinase 1 [Aphelenchoides bicaudatus]